MILNIKNKHLNELVKNSIWTILGTAISKLLLFVVWIVISRLLTVGEYGEFGIIRSTTTMFASFAGFSLGITSTKYISQYKNCEIELCGRILGLTFLFSAFTGFFVSLSVFFLSDFIACAFLHDASLTYLIKLASIIMFFNSINGAQIGALYGLEKFKSVAIINVIQIILSFPFFIILTYFFGVKGSVVSLIIYNFIICLLSYYLIKISCKRMNIRIDYRNAIIERNIIYTYSFPAFLSGLLVLPIRWFTEATLFSQNNGAYYMGMFTAATTFQMIIISCVGLINAPFVSLMSKNQEESKKGIISFLNIYTPWFLGVLFSLPIMFFPELGVFLFGKSYNTFNFKLLLSIVALTTIVMMFRQGLSRLIDVYNLQWWGILDNLVWSILLILSFYFLKNYGVIGLSFSYLIAYVINCFLFVPFYLYKKVLNREVIISFESILLWSFIFVSFIFSFLDFSIYTRFSTLIFCFVIISFLIRRLLNLKF